LNQKTKGTHFALVIFSNNDTQNTQDFGYVTCQKMFGRDNHDARKGPPTSHAVSP